MKPIDKDELYQHLSNFLSSKGIDLKQGSYTHGIQKGCTLLTDAINLSHSGLKKAKTQVDQKLDQMRQVIHEKTAPRPEPPAPGAAVPSSQAAPVSGESPPPQAAAPATTQPDSEPAPARKRPAKSKASARKSGKH
jgi:hypothetical protein